VIFTEQHPLLWMALGVLAAFYAAFQAWRNEYRSNPLHRISPANVAEVPSRLDRLAEEEREVARLLILNGPMLENQIEDALKAAGQLPVNFDRLHGKGNLILGHQIAYKFVNPALHTAIAAYFAKAGAALAPRGHEAGLPA
jgi:hypothetical protein